MRPSRRRQNESLKALFAKAAYHKRNPKFVRIALCSPATGEWAMGLVALAIHFDFPTHSAILPSLLKD